MISKYEFIRAMMKVGVSGFTEINLKDIFDMYDNDNSGELSYKEFCGAIFGNNTHSLTKTNDNSKKHFLERNE